MIHFMMESGDEPLKQALMRYLKYFRDLAGKTPFPAQEGMRLEHAYVDTFHQLDMKDVTTRWEAWVGKLARMAGLDWKRP